MSKIFCAKIIRCKIYVNKFPWDCDGFLMFVPLKCMKIFPDPQGQLTSKSEVRSGKNLNS